MLHVRKDRAGSTSYGYEWTADGEIVQVPDDVAADLVAIPDGGFAIVDPPEASPDETPSASADADAAAEQSAELTEPAPDAGEFTEAPAAGPRKRAAKKTAASPDHGE